MVMIHEYGLIMIMESYHHHAPPRAVRGSIGGCSMDMWCPDGIGRESWDREGREGIGLTPSPERGRFRKLVCFPSAGAGGAPRIELLLLLLLLLDTIVSLQIIIVGGVRFPHLQTCPTVQLECLDFSETSFSH